MGQLLRKKKALTTMPIKVGQPVGASLAFLGMAGAIPLLHGSQGCSAFSKVFLVRHFREPIAMQTTAMEQITTIMGSDGNISEALHTLCSNNAARLIGLISTSLSAAQGSEMARVIKEFRAEHPAWNHVPIIPVEAPDFTGSLESGFAAAVKAMIGELVPVVRPVSKKETAQKRVNLLVGSALTPGDLEELQQMLADFQLQALILPNLAHSLDGHLAREEYSPLSLGGTDSADLQRLAEAEITLVIGHSLEEAADLLKQRTGVPDVRFASLMGMDSTDHLLTILSRVSGKAVPANWIRYREQYQDALLDSHFLLGQRAIAIACEADQLLGWHALLREVGAEIPLAVVPVATAALINEGPEVIRVGDLWDVQRWAGEAKIDLLIANSQAETVAQQLHIPLLRVGYPIHDRLGAFRQCRIGYRGGRDSLFQLANLLLEQRTHTLSPYISSLSDPSLPATGAA
ncbi:nitrogenase iron-molybdenum cofactor biosynthesis protein NifN [Candidatus Magnetaquicoccus inordinatus]|uniref:nitrogenase iron-molybdenum cofactor biosynthesis protein NifN n=1 Tax=Candidatus Magnetaquicoccus inordinatus TaxID=2496818 RepID=UPI00187D5DC3|nr:nitrogenase iron-molybdenum cofactor biosynthesis protein NifN [Candidatus Magnetaquicoccus inordinatus]